MGRSLDLRLHYYPMLQKVFPTWIGETPGESFCPAIDRVQPSLICVDADQVTDNLSISIRFDLVNELLKRRLSNAEIPEAWRVRHQYDLGVPLDDEYDGVVQDVHWFNGPIGGEDCSVKPRLGHLPP